MLRTVRQPTFVTINVADFWRWTVADRRFAIVSFALPDEDSFDILPLLRRVFATPPFLTRRSRMGKIARVTREQIRFYTADSWAVQVIRLRGIGS